MADLSPPDPLRDAPSPAPTPSTGPMPALVAHVDWGSDPSRRWVAVARRTMDGGYRVSVPDPVGTLPTFLHRLRDRAGGGSVLVGFDFPIGVPEAWAERAGVSSFPDLLPALGEGRWSAFFEVAAAPDEIRLERPFYPLRPGGTRQAHLVEGLGVGTMQALLRRCERPTPARGAASSLFWTLGAKQVGKGALVGWRELLAPALRDPALPLKLWPFEGNLGELLGPVPFPPPASDLGLPRRSPGDAPRARGPVVVAETYPAEAALHLGMSPPGRGWSKRSQEGRRAQRGAIEAWRRRHTVTFAPSLAARVEDGFGVAPAGEDPFDALVGLLSMLEVALGVRAEGAPEDAGIRTLEGWILGLPP